MGLLRTPPQRVNQGSKSPQPVSQPLQTEETSTAEATIGDLTVAQQTIGDVTMALPQSTNPDTSSRDSLGSPSKVFMPRKPGVMRSPPSQPLGQSISAYPPLPASLPPPPTPGGNEEVSMEIDEPTEIMDTSSSMDMTSTPSRVYNTNIDSKTPQRVDQSGPLVQEEIEVDISLPSLAPTTPGQQTSISFAATESPLPPPPATPGPTRQADTDVEMHTSPKFDNPSESYRPDTTVGDTTTNTAFQTPKPKSAPKTPRSTRKTPAEIAKVLNKPAEPVAGIPITMEIDSKAEDHGRRWRMTNETIQLVTKRIIEKWSLDDLKSTLPLLSKKDSSGFAQVYKTSAQSLQEGILNKAYEEFEKRDVRTSLQLLDQVVSEADQYEKTRKSDQARPDAWRPDLTPAALTAANVLKVYDEAWASMREEYLELHEDARRRYISILTKQQQLKELEGSVSDGVVELEKTIKLLDGFPNEEMMAWMEDVAGRGGAREP